MKRLSAQDETNTATTNANITSGIISGVTSYNKVAITAPASAATLTIANNKTLTVSNSITLAGTDSTTMTFPGATDTVAALAAVQTITGAWSFNDAKLVLNGATSGNTTLKSGAAAGTSVITLPVATDTLVGKATTDTLTNKRITKRTGTTTSSATPTINTDNVDFYSLTAQTADITSFTTNLSGTPTTAQTLWIAITGTASRAITWGASFEASTVALPTTTSGTSRLDVGFIWNDTSSKWRCVATC